MIENTTKKVDLDNFMWYLFENNGKVLDGFMIPITGIHPERRCAHLKGKSYLSLQDVNKKWKR